MISGTYYQLKDINYLGLYEEDFSTIESKSLPYFPM